MREKEREQERSTHTHTPHTQRTQGKGDKKGKATHTHRHTFTDRCNALTCSVFIRLTVPTTTQPRPPTHPLCPPYTDWCGDCQNYAPTWRGKARIMTHASCPAHARRSPSPVSYRGRLYHATSMLPRRERLVPLQPIASSNANPKHARRGLAQLARLAGHDVRRGHQLWRRCQPSSVQLSEHYTLSDHQGGAAVPVLRDSGCASVLPVAVCRIAAHVTQPPLFHPPSVLLAPRKAWVGA